MSQASNYLETKIRDHFKLRTQLPLMDTYVALFKSDPTDAATGVEVGVGAYARKKVNQDGTTSPYWTDLGSDAMQNGQIITFPTATADWGDITHRAIFDALTGGNLLAHHPLGTPLVVLSGQVVTIPAGALVLRVA